MIIASPHHVDASDCWRGSLPRKNAAGLPVTTPRPEYRFRGLVPGDHWCLCALRWREAFEAGAAPAVVLAATHERALDFVSLEWLRAHALHPVG